VDKAFKSLKLSLRKGGILIFDIFDAERTRQHQFGEWERDVFEFEDMTITRLSKSSDYRERDGTWFVEWEYTIEKWERQVVRDQARLRSFNQEQLKGLLERYGFRITSTIKRRMLILQTEKV
jgi:hypothetical protein